MSEIVLEDVWKVFRGGVEAVKSFDLEIADGEFVVLVGPSGCGKTTVLRMVAGLERISKGSIRIGDKVVNEVPPKERDIAMVFQNYALYPHMSVYDNMAFGLKLQKVPRTEIEERVREAARILDLDEYLKRKPAALSGGQRQRVAMGRAIVRHPQAFLMDEPLSNLDAKLRVQTRTEISRLQHELGVTTIYVTHDQVEAMTMGDRVAVMRKGVLQQVDIPETLYDRPVNLFVAGFIGSPAMNLLEATLQPGDDGALVVELGDTRLPVPAEIVAQRPGLRAYSGRPIILGIRPEDIEDASLMADAPPERRIRSTVDLREALGSDVLVHFTMDAAPAVTDDVVELALDAGHAGDEAAQRVAADQAHLIARLNPRTRAANGEPIELEVDTRRMHYFDPEAGSAIYDESPTEAPQAVTTTTPTDSNDS
ncbi:MAG TPA: sn-glycerol-3-phosphate ABC transporter ATP-binding protein UgpC [Acidimicrobiales bacterium]|nr:sn-glycerol-3-phosphate ABC transporter ATP-binding protein UgpC [Acidimicrobiales bacterium]